MQTILLLYLNKLFLYIGKVVKRHSPASLPKLSTPKSSSLSPAKPTRFHGNSIVPVIRSRQKKESAKKERLSIESVKKITKQVSEKDLLSAFFDDKNQSFSDAKVSNKDHETFDESFTPRRDEELKFGERTQHAPKVLFLLFFFSCFYTKPVYALIDCTT